ncbi:MAG: signal peptide peptidase SppA [Bacteroidota bacterium]
MRNFLSSLLATIVGILIMTLLIVLIFAGIVAVSKSQEVPEVTENSLLLAKFNAPIADRSDENPLSRFMSGNPYSEDMMGLNQILKDLDKAAADEKIKGIFLKLGNVSAGVATLGEIRDALLEFKESGKFIYAYADVYSQKSYYLASAADTVFMTPEGMLLFTGLSAEINFYKNALKKAGVDMQVVKHGSYKSAAERFTREDLSKENQEQIEAYMGAVWDKIVGDIAESRQIPEEELNRIADQLTTLDADKLVETGMIDGLIYYDEMLSLIKGKMGVEEEDDLESISLKQYKDVPAEEKKEYSRDKIAVIYAMGTVVDGNAGEGMIGSERIARAIRKARRDKSVKAIVFRINSGGGSALASDVIYREAMLAAKEKPLVASMGDVAASGGYYIAAPADTILASPGTITGSIGVVFTLPNMQELMNNKLGVTTDVVKTNRHADMLTIMDPLDPVEKVYVQRMVDDTYKAFVNVVAQGRGMTFEEVDAIGGGRVWAGEDALDNGLIDMFGGLERSIEIAAEMAGLEIYRIQSLPTLEDPLTMIMKELKGGATARSSRAIKQELGDLYVHYRTLKEIGEMHGVQAIMPFEIELH